MNVAKNEMLSFFVSETPPWMLFWSPKNKYMKSPQGYVFKSVLKTEGLESIYFSKFTARLPWWRSG